MDQYIFSKLSIVLEWNGYVLSCDRVSGRCPKLKEDRLAELHYLLYMRQQLVLLFGSFQSHFRHHSVHFSFIELRLYAKEGVANKIPFIACRK